MKALDIMTKTALNKKDLPVLFIDIRAFFSPQVTDLGKTFDVLDLDTQTYNSSVYKERYYYYPDLLKHLVTYYDIKFFTKDPHTPFSKDAREIIADIGIVHDMLLLSYSPVDNINAMKKALNQAPCQDFMLVTTVHGGEYETFIKQHRLYGNHRSAAIFTSMDGLNLDDFDYLTKFAFNIEFKVDGTSQTNQDSTGHPNYLASFYDYY